MDVVVWLCSPDAARPLAAADAAVTAHPADPLAAGSQLRRGEPGLPADRAAAALEQATLRRSAAQRYGIDASRLLLTRDGLEQATRPEVSTARAELIRAAGATRVVDLTAGLGFDSAAFAAAGLQVTSIERDPRVAALCRHNVPAADVLVGDATDPALLDTLLARLGPQDVVFVDPARRSTDAPRALGSARARPERDPERWSPPWSFIASIPHPRIVVKAAPAFEPPAGWAGQWTSLDRTVLECTAYSWPALTSSRRAVVLGGGGPQFVDDLGGDLPAARTIGAWLLEPDPAITRAGVESALGTRHPGVAALGPGSSWLTCEDPPTIALAGLVRAYRVVTELMGSGRQRRDELRRLGVTALAVKNRDVREDPSSVLRQLGCRAGTGRTLVMTAWQGRTISLLADPVPVPRG